MIQKKIWGKFGACPIYLLFALFGILLSPFIFISTAYGASLQVELQARSAVTGQSHIVQAGDTLTRIARRYGTSVSALQDANGLDGNDYIYLGQKLYIPVQAIPDQPSGNCQLYHQVRPGESLSRIALNHNVTIEALSAANNIGKPDSIRMGVALCIPKNVQMSQSPKPILTSISPPPTPRPSPTFLPPVFTATSTATSIATPIAIPTKIPTIRSTETSVEVYTPPSGKDKQPTGYLYVAIQEGDTIDRLAESYDTTAEFLRYLNRLSDVEAIEFGKTIVIPTYGEFVEKSTEVPTIVGAIQSTEPSIEQATDALFTSIFTSTSIVTSTSVFTSTSLPTTIPNIASVARSTLISTPTPKPTKMADTAYLAAANTPTVNTSPVNTSPVNTSTVMSTFKLTGQFTVVGIEPDKGLNFYSEEPGMGGAIIGQIPAAQQAISGFTPIIIIDDTDWMFVATETVGWVDSQYLAPSRGWIAQEVASRANDILFALRNQDMETLAQLAHPEGVRFSPYAYLDQKDLIFMPDELQGLPTDSNVYRWGIYDGSGESIEMAWTEYYQQFVWAADFAFPNVVGYGMAVSNGNMIDNSKAIYPEAVTIEYHFDGFDPGFGGLDWRSLRLVLEEVEGEWYLVAVINDQWTI